MNALRRSPKNGDLTATTVNSLADRVDHQGGQGLALDVLGDDQQRLVVLRGPSPAAGSRSASAEIFSRTSRMYGVLEDGLAGLRVGDEVREM